MTDVRQMNIVSLLSCFVGYTGIYKKRLGDKPDGCAIFYKEKRFSLLSHHDVEYNRPNIRVLNRDNIALIAVLKPRESLEGNKSPVVVANTHLLYNKNRGDIKLAQLAYLFAELDRVGRVGFSNMAKHTKCFKDAHSNNVYLPMLVCGDFNCTPFSPLYRFITSSRLQFQGLNNVQISGQNRIYELTAWTRPFGISLLPYELKMSYSCKWIPDFIGHSSDGEYIHAKGDSEASGTDGGIGRKRRRNQMLKLTGEQNIVSLSCMDSSNTISNSKCQSNSFDSCSYDASENKCCDDTLEKISGSSGKNVEMSTDNNTSDNSYDANTREKTHKSSENVVDKYTTDDTHENACLENAHENTPKRSSGNSMNSNTDEKTCLEDTCVNTFDRSPSSVDKCGNEDAGEIMCRESTRQTTPVSSMNNLDKCFDDRMCEKNGKENTPDQSGNNVDKCPRVDVCDNLCDENTRENTPDTSRNNVDKFVDDRTCENMCHESICETMPEKSRISVEMCVAENMCKNTSDANIHENTPDSCDDVLIVGVKESPRARSRTFDDEELGVLKHALNLTSSHKHYLSDEHANVAVCHDKSCCTVDYIFYSPGRFKYVSVESEETGTDEIVEVFPRGQLYLTGALSQLGDIEPMTKKLLPNAYLSSDHISVVASFKLFE